MFQKGDRVQILKDPFSEFIGVVDRVNTARRRLLVLVTFYGRQMPVAPDFPDVKKL